VAAAALLLFGVAAAVLLLDGVVGTALLLDGAVVGVASWEKINAGIRNVPMPTIRVSVLILINGKAVVDIFFT
jgi:hypothetical protein